MWLFLKQYPEKTLKIPRNLVNIFWNSIALRQFKIDITKFMAIFSVFREINVFSRYTVKNSHTKNSWTLLNFSWHFHNCRLPISPSFRHRVFLYTKGGLKIYFNVNLWKNMPKIRGKCLMSNMKLPSHFLIFWRLGC